MKTAERIAAMTARELLIELQSAAEKLGAMNFQLEFTSGDVPVDILEARELTENDQRRYGYRLKRALLHRMGG